MHHRGSPWCSWGRPEPGRPTFQSGSGIRAGQAGHRTAFATAAEWVARLPAVHHAGRWDEVFGDDVVAAAMIDRLVHHAEVIALKGDSCRLRDRDLGRLPAATTTEH